MEYKDEIINYLIKKYDLHSYLEIGLENTNNFRYVECELKESCDPYFLDEKGSNGDIICADENGELLPHIKECLTYRMTSDEMFDNMSLDKKYDLIFIDGLHEADQVARDIYHASLHLNKGGFIIAHDALPESGYAAQYPRPNCTIGTAWNGDCYKAIAYLSRFDIDFHVVDMDFGVCVIRDQEQLNALYEYKAKDEFQWRDFMMYRDEMMHVISADEFLRLY